MVDIKMKKKSVAELGYSCRLKIYVDPKKLRCPGHFSKMARYIWLKFCLEYK